MNVKFPKITAEWLIFHEQNSCKKPQIAVPLLNRFGKTIKALYKPEIPELYSTFWLVLDHCIIQLIAKLIVDKFKFSLHNWLGNVIFRVLFFIQPCSHVSL